MLKLLVMAPTNPEWRKELVHVYKMVDGIVCVYVPENSAWESAHEDEPDRWSCLEDFRDYCHAAKYSTEVTEA